MGRRLRADAMSRGLEGLPSPEGRPKATHDLAAADYPVTLRALRADNLAVVWAVTLLCPPRGQRAPLYVPPLARWEGVPIFVEVTTAQGVRTRTGPYGIGR